MKATACTCEIWAHCHEIELTVTTCACSCIPSALERSGYIAAYGVLVIAGAFTFAIGGPATSW